MEQSIIDQVFGRLKVIKQEGSYKNGTKLYICICECGGTAKTSLPHLRRGEVQSCGCLAKEAASKNGKLGKINLLNKRFGRLVIIAEADTDRYGVKWVCQCDCGNKITVPGANLRKDDGTRSCGCIRHEALIVAGKKRRVVNPWAVEINQYKSGANQRELKFELTEDCFKALVLSPCHYCGLLPETKCQGTELREQNIVKNGIDRKNPSLGYTTDNCVSCCWPCNEDKSNETYEEFIQNTKRRYEHLKSKGLI